MPHELRTAAAAYRDAMIDLTSRLVAYRQRESAGQSLLRSALRLLRTGA